MRPTLMSDSSSVTTKSIPYVVKMSSLLLLCCITASFITTSLSFSSCYNSEGQPIACSPSNIDNILYGVTPVATSTCGQNERVCEKGGLQCSECNSTHSPSKMTDSDPLSYWQSQPYSTINDTSVIISFQLMKSFIIDEINLVFHSPRPHSFSLHASSDYGETYYPLYYYSLSCLETYGLEEGAKCTSDGVGLIPLTGGRASYHSPSPKSLSVTNIRISLDRLVLLPDIETWNPLIMDSYWYALSDVSISGRCECNGHSSSCVKDTNGHYHCICAHNTTGIDCQTCLPSHNDLPWQPATNQNTVIECRGNYLLLLMTIDSF